MIPGESCKPRKPHPHNSRSKRSRRAARQLKLEFRTRGGARNGAGRPPNGARAGVPHLVRPTFSRRHPLHITLKVRPGLTSLRAPALFPKVRAALAAGRHSAGFRLVHFSVQRDHLHLIAEARERATLSRGVQALSVRIARAVNHALSRCGRLFADRYHARALTSPRSVRFALRYVLLNERKHARAAARRSAVPSGFVDPCSSAAWFNGFARPGSLAFGAQECRNEFARWHPALDAPVLPPETWLLQRGFLRAGPLDVDDTPG